MRSVELFTGAGGLALGLERAGFAPVFQVEWDDHACKTIIENAKAGGPTANWPLEHGDVRDFSFRGLGPIDLVAGGPPCQPFSIAGKHRGSNDRRDMWPEAIRAVRDIKPKAFFFENVRGLARPAFAEYLSYILERLKRPSEVARRGETWMAHLSRLREMSRVDHPKAAYRVEIHKVNAANFGAPQKRHRVVVVGTRADIYSTWGFPAETHSRDALVWSKFITGEYWERHKIPSRRRPSPTPEEDRILERLKFSLARPDEAPWVTVRDAISDLPDPRRGSGTVANHRFQPGARSYAGHTGSPLDEPAKALKAGDHGVPGGENMLVESNGDVRYFTVRESARLQGFPDDFVFPGSWTESMRQLGNAVPVPMAESIAGSLIAMLKGTVRSRKSLRAA